MASPQPMRASLWHRRGEAQLKGAVAIIALLSIVILWGTRRALPLERAAGCAILKLEKSP